MNILVEYKNKVRIERKKELTVAKISDQLNENLENDELIKNLEKILNELRNTMEDRKRLYDFRLRL